jgi:hypothetical protein
MGTVVQHKKKALALPKFYNHFLWYFLGFTEFSEQQNLQYLSPIKNGN